MSEKKEMGRPRAKINKEEFEKLCAMQCTEVEIAEFFNCTDDTINGWCKREYGETFSETYKKKSAKGRVSLRRMQFQMAETNPTLLIWLGKQWLNQRERQTVAVESDEESKELLQSFMQEIKSGKGKEN